MSAIFSKKNLKKAIIAASLIGLGFFINYSLNNTKNIRRKKDLVTLSKNSKDTIDTILNNHNLPYNNYNPFNLEDSANLTNYVNTNNSFNSDNAVFNINQINNNNQNSTTYWYNPAIYLIVKEEKVKLKRTDKVYLSKRLEREKPSKNYIRDKHALIISGSVDARDMYDLSTAYQVFLENGFQKENIYILDGDGTKTPIYPVDGKATKTSIDLVLNHISKKIDKEDLFFLYITDHGDRVNYTDPTTLATYPISKIKIPGEDLNEIELEKMLNKIKSKQTIVLADICFGGGFAKRFSKGNYIGISSSEDNEQSRGTQNYTFGRCLMKAYREVSKADLDSNNIVDIYEAFIYAKKNDPWTRTGEDTCLIKSELNLRKISLQK